MTQFAPYYDPNKVDLHELTRQLGTEHVAAAVGISRRWLVTLRQGQSPMPGWLLGKLEAAFPQLDVAATVWRIGRGRGSARTPAATIDDLYVALAGSATPEEGRQRLVAVRALLGL